jgi:hypothetical protein
MEVRGTARMAKTRVAFSPHETAGHPGAAKVQTVKAIVAMSSIRNFPNLPLQRQKARNNYTTKPLPSCVCFSLIVARLS